MAVVDFTELREQMVRRQIEERGIRDSAVLDAFRAVPREEFVSDDHKQWAYDDHPLPIEAGQTISQPYIVAVMIEAAEIGRGDTVLEIGAGSGYAAAVIGQIADSVLSIERQPELARIASKRLNALGYANVRVIEGDGTRGCVEEAPFDAILAAASGSHVPERLLAQLAPGGRLVMPVGDPGSVQHLLKVTKAEDGRIERYDLGAVRFVPLIGEEGWKDA